MLIPLNRFLGTLLNKEWYLVMIENLLKDSEIKHTKFDIPPEVTHLLMLGNEAVRQKYRKYIVARLLDREALGPFWTGKKILEASVKPGKEFKTGMSERELDQFIMSKGRTGPVYVYRFCDATVATDAKWHHCMQNNNPGFRRAWREDGAMRFEVQFDDARVVRQAVVEPASRKRARAFAAKGLTSAEKAIMQGPKIPRRAKRGVEPARKEEEEEELPAHYYDLTLDEQENR